MQASPVPSSSPPVASLGELLARARIEPPAGAEAALARPVTGLAYDSRAVTAGAVFVAIRGARHDGATFASDACDRGACAVIAECDAPAETGAPWIRVPDARAALAAAAAALHGDPSRALRVVGTTGTNGKTTTSYLLESIFEHSDIPTGRISTVAHRTTAGEERPAERTTPEASDVQALLARMRDNGARACVMEVSSHALALRRVDHVRFEAAVFTNLTRDHLDFHGDMEGYFAAKRRLFESLPSKRAGRHQRRRPSTAAGCSATSPDPSPTASRPRPTCGRSSSTCRGTGSRWTPARRPARCTSVRRCSAASMRTTCWPRRQRQPRSTCPPAASRRAYGPSRRCRGAWRSSPGMPTTSRSSSISRIPMRRFAARSRRFAPSRRAVSSRSSVAAAAATCRSAL